MTEDDELQMFETISGNVANKGPLGAEPAVKRARLELEECSDEV